MIEKDRKSIGGNFNELDSYILDTLMKIYSKKKKSEIYRLAVEKLDLNELIMYTNKSKEKIPSTSGCDIDTELFNKISEIKNNFDISSADILKYSLYILLEKNIEILQCILKLAPESKQK